ncbi:hypothetical protein BG32_00765 [Mesotoga sp. HF07.pep.5.2.highcov]|nr:hypothetical protein BG32_00765 [Mesotoga sp. HF07.pep.5.2.highcov]
MVLTKYVTTILAGQQRAGLCSVQRLLASAQRLLEQKILNQVQNDGMWRFFGITNAIIPVRTFQKFPSLSSRTCFGIWVSILAKYGSVVLAKYVTTILAGQQRTGLCSVQRLLASAQRLLEKDMGV